MPELPEVETVRRSLEPHVVGRRITAVAVRERRLRRTIDDDFESRLRGRAIRALNRRGKYLLGDLDNGETLLVHLGMSGSLQLRDRDASAARHDHVFIEIDAREVVVLNDPRRFGAMRVGVAAAFAELNAIGPDPLTTVRSADEWRHAVRTRHLPIKSLLMDQHFLAGIGNIYANEMLFEAGIRPRRAAARLRRRELTRLEDAMHAVLDRAVALGGSSISDFRDARGRPGYFQMHHTVYDRADQPCPRCATPIRRIVIGGRSTFYCPHCQR
jgi:formamidopyrimidine-DNA glycosylase